MQEIIGVRFKKLGKIYFFDPDGIKFEKGKSAIVETARGLELGEVAVANRLMSEDKMVSSLKKAIRVATDGDVKKYNENEKKAQEAFKVCEEKIKKHGLDMKLKVIILFHSRCQN